MLGVVEPVKAILIALTVGLAVGAVFGALRSVPPAPPSWAGVAGIVGIVAGWQIILKITQIVTGVGPTEP